MRGHIIIEELFIHQGTEHQLLVSVSDGVDNEYRFEVRRNVQGTDLQDIIFDKTENLSALFSQCPNTTMDQLITAEQQKVKNAVINEEDELLAHAP